MLGQNIAYQRIDHRVQGQFLTACPRSGAKDDSSRCRPHFNVIAEERASPYNTRP